ncbi:MAG: 4'-phosphopantetheinyl transferase superfamily protein [Cyanobacteriota bacterium]|nr:4'-phosphopantetheinyl transferase superfamily protein [Cyanobacteriota bacterium]
MQGIPKLTEQVVHIWQVDLRVSDFAFGSLWNLLSEEEQFRANQFKVEQARRTFVIGRGCLRRILSGYEQTDQPDPAKIQFMYSQQGKPSLSTISSGIPLRFNLSHSHQLALIAVGLNAEMGIDLEYIRPTAVEALVQRFFAPSESVFLQGLKGEIQLKTFFRYWTCKEAYIKASGQRLSQSLSQIVIRFDPVSPVGYQAYWQGIPIEPDWWMYEVACPQDYMATLVIDRQIQNLDYFDGFQGDFCQ